MINGDNINNTLERLFYFPQCIINSMLGNKNLVDVCNVKLKTKTTAVNFGSPARRLSNMFWASIKWRNLAELLGEKIHIFDIGCGRGHYGNLYKEYLGASFGSYSGLDIYKHEAFPPDFNHIKDRAENASKHIKKAVNFVTSQSALEHIEGDVATLNDITEILVKQGKPFLQIHLVPASTTLWTYLWHGWRQYSQRNLGVISSKLNTAYDVSIIAIPLGGARSHRVHFFGITLPSLFRKIFRTTPVNNWDTDDSRLSKRIQEVVCSESIQNSRLPVFWALLISNDESYFEALFDINSK